jgi:hypothetical protein
MPAHIIHKQTFDLETDFQDRAHQIGDSVKSTYYEKVLPSLDRIFSDLSPDDQVYRFGQVEVDLGFIPDDDIETELTERITHLVKETLTNQIEQYTFAPPEVRKMEVIPVSASLFDAFVFFLEFGILPWWLAEKENQQPEDIFRDIPQNFNTGRETEIRRILKLEKARVRLARQFSDDFISRILKLTFPDIESISKDFQSNAFTEVSALLAALDKLNIQSAVRENFRVKVMQALYQEILKIDSKIQKQVLVKADDVIGEFSAHIFSMLIKTLVDNGFRTDMIVEIISAVEKSLTENSALKGLIKRTGKSGEKLKKAIKQIQPLTEDGLDDVEQTENIIEDDGPFAEKSGIYIRNAGLILLWPFLKNYFAALGLLAGEKFKSTEEQHKAALLLQYALDGKKKFAEHQLPLNKILCGLPVDEPLRTDLKISKKEIEETEELIESAIETWKAIGKVSVEGFRQSFLQREGRLQQTENGWNLKVERKTIDVLLDKIPWMISMVRLKWMKQMIYVDW